MIKNEILNRILNSVPMSEPQNKIACMSVLVLLENLLNASDDAEKERVISDMKVITEWKDSE